MIEVAHITIVTRVSIVLMGIGGGLSVRHWVSATLHATVRVQDVVYGRDGSWTPDGRLTGHHICGWGTDHGRFTVYWGGRGWGWGLGLLWGRGFGFPLLCFLLLSAFGASVFKPNLQNKT